MSNPEFGPVAEEHGKETPVANSERMESGEFKSHEIAREHIKSLLERATRLREMRDGLITIINDHTQEQSNIHSALEPMRRATQELDEATKQLIQDAMRTYESYSRSIANVTFEDWQLEMLGNTKE